MATVSGFKKLYVSYAYDQPGTDEVIQLLEDICKEHRISLDKDSEKVRCGDSFQQFMEDMSESARLVVIASYAYFFRSYYCMHELTQTYKKGNLLGRVIPIWLNEDELKPNEPDWQKKCIQFWSDPEQWGTIKAADETKVAVLNESLAATLEQFGDLKAWFPKQNDKQMLAMDILYPTPSGNESLIIERTADHDFLGKLNDSLQANLEAVGLLNALSQPDESTSDCTKRLTSEACEDLKRVLMALIRAVKAQNNQDLNINHIEEIFFQLAMFTINQKWIDQWKDKEKLNNMYMKIDTTQSSIALLAVSRLHQITTPKFEIDYEKNTPDLWGRDRILPPARCPSWHATRTVEEVLKKIWNHVFKDNMSTPLNKEQLQQLNEDISWDYEMEAKQFHITNHDSEFNYLKDPAVLYGLQKYLPALLILILNKPSGEQTVLLQNDIEVATALRKSLFALHKMSA